ncbi:AbiH family protein [Sphingobacterium spiritivorum]|uniref:AbiH family protein n=1 Tax=Sphingobacterium spiritivorum TaxID=258 RepID=UPI003DA42A9C
MNKLIIVGNGFDLHNKLPTKYEDFLSWFLKKEFEKAINHTTYSNDFFTVFCYKEPSTKSIELNDFSEILNYLPKMNITLQGKKLSYFTINGKSYRIQIQFISEFFKAISFQYQSKKWVDIEMEYYTLLRYCLDQYKGDHGTHRLKKLNEGLYILKNQLCDYLAEVSEKKQVNSNFYYCAKANINPDIIMDKHHLKKLSKDDFSNDLHISPQKVLFLNFNYTGLTYEIQNEPNFKTIDIHGKLGDVYNPPIFGYGDEIDDSYFEMEKLNENDFLLHIKSFGYFANSNYSELVNFLESDSFVVNIWGHSCGLSDRTLLNMIFEHNNCAAIQPYYWQKDANSDDYNFITQNISRHFKNKQKMRSRVVNKSLCRSLGNQQ